eukprot:641406-Rhodomonas_salina.1
MGNNESSPSGQPPKQTAHMPNDPLGKIIFRRGLYLSNSHFAMCCLVDLGEYSHFSLQTFTAHPEPVLPWQLASLASFRTTPKMLPVNRAGAVGSASIVSARHR